MKEALAWFVAFVNETRAVNNRHFTAFQNISDRITALEATTKSQHNLNQAAIKALREKTQLLLINQSLADECVKLSLQ